MNEILGWPKSIFLALFISLIILMNFYIVPIIDLSYRSEVNRFKAIANYVLDK